MLVTADKSSDESHKLKNIVRTVGTKLIREKLAQYIKELRQGKLFKSNRQFFKGMNITKSAMRNQNHFLFICLPCDFLHNSRGILCMGKAINNDFNK